MKENMNTKVSDIMNGRMSSTYIRNTIDICHKDFKNLK